MEPRITDHIWEVEELLGSLAMFEAHPSMSGTIVAEGFFALRVPLVLLLMLQVSGNGVSSSRSLISVELADGYSIKVPDNFILHRISAAASSVPAIDLVKDTDHRRTQFRVTVKLLGDHTLVVLDKHKPHFTISGERDIYYEISVDDASADCTMNQICPPPGTPPFTAWYKFEFYDKPRNTRVTFEASEDVPSKNFQGFVGVGKLLRYVVVPSLTSNH